MSYIPIKWINGSTPLSAQNLNHMEQGVKDNETYVTTKINEAIRELSTISMIPDVNNVIGGIFKTGTNITQEYIVPDNGYINGSCYMSETGTAPIVALDNNYISHTQQIIKEIYSYHFLIPVAKGDKVKLIFRNSKCTEIYMYFIYAKKGV